MLSTAGEDDMSTLLGLMQTVQLQDLELKNAVLKSLLHTLRESHRTRTTFRKSGGYVYVVSVLISLEGSLQVPAREPWLNVDKASVFAILKTILNTLTVSMRYEPANAKFFKTDVRWKAVEQALKLIGCFDTSRSTFESNKNTESIKRGFDVFEEFFCTLDEQVLKSQINDSDAAKYGNTYQMDERLVYVTHIMRFLYDTAIDSFDK